MSEESGLIKNYRNRVMGIAAGLMVYTIAGGSVSTVEKESSAEVTLFGVKLLFSRPDWLVAAAVMLLVYFWWRHYQLISPFRKDFVNRVYRNIIVSKGLVDKVNLGLEGGDDIVQSDSDYGVEVKRKDITRDEYEKGLDYIIKVKNSGFLTYEVTLFEISSWQLQYHLDRGTVSSDFAHSKTKRFETSRLSDRLQLSFYYWRSFVSLAIKQPDFTDAYIPEIIAAIAVVLFFLERIF